MKISFRECPAETYEDIATRDLCGEQDTDPVSKLISVNIARISRVAEGSREIRRTDFKQSF